MNRIKGILVLFLAAAVFWLGVAGCNAEHEHPAGEHPTSEHPTSEHPQ
ncbi:MAG: hypothetical protein ACYSTJ_00905 [Planctomycetota bacterium]|jgi:hypothetical protein